MDKIKIGDVIQDSKIWGIDHSWLWEIREREKGGVKELYGFMDGFYIKNSNKKIGRTFDRDHIALLSDNTKMLKFKIIGTKEILKDIKMK